MDFDAILGSIDEDAIEEAVENAALALKDSVIAAAIEFAKALVAVLKEYFAGIVG